MTRTGAAQTIASEASDAAGLDQNAECLECGAPVSKKAGKAHQFCSKRCSKAWSNRRMTRGAVLYDVFMESRFNRDQKTRDGKGLISVANGLASQFRQEDRERRDGRRSWRRYADTIERHPWIGSVVTSIKAGR